MSEASPRPRVVFALDLYPDGGGISSIVENCAMALHDRFEIHVAVVDAREGTHQQLSLPAHQIHTLTSHHLLKPYLMPTSLLYPLRVGAFLRRLVNRLQPDVLLVQDGLFLPLPGRLATSGTATRLVVMDHGTLTNTMDPVWQQMFPTQLTQPRRTVFKVGFRLDKPWREFRWRAGLCGADEVWYVGEEMKPWIARAGARGRQYKQLVPPDFEAGDTATRVAARRRFGVEDDAPVVTMVNRLAVEKGMSEALEAMTVAAGMFPQSRFLVAGDGPLEGWLRKEIAARDLSEHVHVLGRLARADVRSLLHASDFFLYTGTISCGMSLALLEAMAAGVIPIVSDVPREQRDLVADAGWVYPAASPDQLVDALAAALAVDTAERTRLVQRVHQQLATYAEPSIGTLIDELLCGR
jgi:glycosyltransferase involved in cell wall biosynthesis